MTDIFDFKKPRQTASLDWGASNVPGNPDVHSISVPGSTGTLVRDRVKNPATSSQEWQKDNPCPGSTRKLVQSGTCERSGSIGKQVQGVENQLARTRLDFHNVQISDCQFVEKVFEKIRQKLRRSSYELDGKTNVSILRLFMSTTMKVSVHFGFHYNENLAAHRNTNFKELKTLIDMTSRSILEQSLRDPECIYDDVTFRSLDVIYFVSQPSYRVDESKSLRPLRFCVMSGKDTWSFRSEWEVEKSTSRLPTNQRVQRIIWNRWRTNWIRVENFPGRTSLQLLQKIQEYLNVRKRKPEQFEGIILFMSMFNDIVWTKKGFREGKRLREKISARTLVIHRVLDKKNKRYGTYTHKPEGKWNEVADLIAENIEGSGHPIFRGINQCAQPRNPQEKKWKIYDSLYCGILENWTLISHTSLDKSAQYLRSTIKLVRRFGWKASWSDILERSQINFKSEPVISEVGSARNGFLGTDSEEDWGSSWKQLAWWTSTIQRTGCRSSSP